MKYDDFYEARDKIIEILRKDFLGPLSDNEIICDERPLEYYITGKLYPQKSNAEDVVTCSSDDIGDLDSDSYDQLTLCNGNNPSSLGISFTLMPSVPSFDITVSAAYYSLISKDEAQKELNFRDDEYSDKAHFWRRNKIDYSTNPSIPVSDLIIGHKKTIFITDKLSLNILLHKIYDDGSKTVTVTLVNENLSTNDYLEESLNSFFQPEIIISTSSEIPAFADIRKNFKFEEDDEVLELNMLYSKVRNYASGHGCAVSWETDERGHVTRLKTEYLPEFELRQMKPSTSFKHKVLSMKYISEAPADDVISGLRLLTALYSKWIKDQDTAAKSLDKRFKRSAEANIKKCSATLDRLNKAIDKLEGDKTAYRAFALANKAMFMQRKKTYKYDSDDDIKWYPFQLAFFLQETLSFTMPESYERKTVDLLWFPTGGGKTEAYLGIAAFVIFLRRLRHGNKGDGVTVLMRYTLRLLSFQQFERAAALVFACEIIRKIENIPGGEISIGLWAGRGLTPNYVKDAKRILDGKKDALAESSNPAQIKKCPWCGEPIPAAEPYYHCDETKKRMYIKCPNKQCDFKTGMPLYLIDEEIYTYTPTYIIATVDKFAQVALNENTGSLFGIGNGKLPPELIIQDELHLISGPLGTITGLYEAAIKKLCTRNNIYPKVIASTATIRNAKEQIKALYASDYTQFPPQCIDIDNSFFAEVSERSDRPARRYMGCMAVGTSPTTMMIRVMASLLFATRYLMELGYDEKVIDSFWTLTGYYNTLRELGGAIVRVVDDIQDRFLYLKKGKFKDIYPLRLGQDRYEKYKELTSRESSENIGSVIQEELKIPYTKSGKTIPYDFLLASNMISVGVDVSRLGTMVVVGQPKATSEYIQATSRVGRNTPGLVITTYNQAKSRDRSHYEQFTQYHESFYKFVEATSLTPFSDRARDRALQALYIILCRYTIPRLLSNDSAVNFNKNIPELKNIREYILNYVNLVDPGECNNVEKEIEEIENKWEIKASRASILKYHDFFKVKDTLFEPDYKEDSRFRVLNTMRSVETTVNVYTEE